MDNQILGIIMTIVIALGIYYMMWRRMPSDASRKYFFLIGIGALMSLGAFSLPSLSKPSSDVVFATSIIGFIIMIVSVRKYNQSTHK